MVDENTEVVKQESSIKNVPSNLAGDVSKFKSGVAKGFSKADVIIKGKKQPRIRTTGMVNPLPVFSKSQMMMRELFGENRHFGTGQNLPVINHALTSGGGLLRHDDMFERRTAKMFGLRY